MANVETHEDERFDPDELERLADESSAEFDAFLDELTEPLNKLRRIAGLKPRHLRQVLAEGDATRGTA